MKVERCKGFGDLSPEKMAGFRLIEAVFRDRCLRWGYREVRTPTLEYLYLFTSVGTLTPGMLGRVYSFLDWDGWSGERVVLRPDGTIPIARLYIDSMADKGLARLFYVTNVFMFEETGKKSRERWQCGTELIGVNSVVADVELVTLALEVLRGLGLKDIRIRLSHAGLIRALLQRLELSPGERTAIFNRILDGDIGALAGIKPDKPELVEALALLLRLKGKSSGFLKNIKAVFAQKLPEFEPSLDSFIGVVGLLETLGCDYRIDLASGKGFEYYTGIIFNLSVGEEKVGGGGRYDALIPLMGGRDTPAAGFALYLDSLMKLIKAPVLSPPMARRVLVRAAPEAVEGGFGIARRLRGAGFIAELALDGQEVADYGFILEVQPDKFTLTDRLSGKKSLVTSAEELVDTIKRASRGEYPIKESVMTRQTVARHVLWQFQELSQQQEVETLISPLTARETEVVDYMAQGYANKQIAATLNISEQTIKSHVSAILRKLNANDRAHAVVAAILGGEVDVAQDSLA